MYLRCVLYQTFWVICLRNTKDEYVELLNLHRMGFHVECKSLAHIMKTKRQTSKRNNTKKLVKKRSVGRPRKSKIKYDELSSKTPLKTIKMRTQVATSFSVEKAQNRSTVRPSKTNSEVHVSSSSVENIVYQPPIAKTTSALLRNMLLSTDRTRFNRSTTNTCLTISNNNNPYCNYYQLDKSKPLNLEISHRTSSFVENSSRGKWKNSNKKLNMPTNEIKSTVSGNSYLPNLQSFPDIPQLADVDINASFELDNSNYSMNDQTDTETLCIDDSDTLSNESAENIEQEQQEFDQRWAMSVRMESGEMSTPFVNCETFNSLDDVSLLGPQDTALVQNDVIQNYIETNDVQFMQLPDSSCEVIRTLQYYESRLLTSPWSFPEHLQNHNEPISNQQTGLNEQLNTTASNHTLAEFANMLPCPIAGCLWYSHSATLYVHLFTCHQEMIYYGNSISHVFRCQDIQNFCFFTHLQFIQNTIYIITVAFDGYSHTFVATIQHVSSYGDNTSASQTTAILTTSSLCNDTDQHSWSGPVQPYSVPLDVLHADGRCLFIDPTNSEQMIINVDLTVPLVYSNDSMFACL
ncbi:uncharacterized protein LOC112598945 [Melanaphis sacchari]|uniref:uncharacterized protein LOC112598945 n=1 Tax=Melanaphis sacchari TaxID=742174 RepID=UPI000DC13F8B|nr:uncharacterized protein LOC112598945 [Melanaphis sacchari]